jgi:NRPS condensation-like uncharacterized protein
VYQPGNPGGGHMNRELGANERVVWMTIQDGSISFVVVAHLSGVLDEHIIESALGLLSQKHPLLRTRIIIEGDCPKFTSEDVPPIPLRVETRQNNDQWLFEAEKELNNPLPWSTGPMVRAVLLTSEKATDILVRFQHVVGDGMSGMYLMQHLLQIVGEITRGEQPVIQPLPERPPVEELLPTGGVNEFIKTAALAGKQLTHILVKRPKRLPKDGDAPPAERSTHVVHHMLSAKETESLITECRRESTTVHGAVCAALLKAAANQMFTPSNGGPVTMNCMSAVNLRPFLDPPVGEEVGFYASMVITGHKIKKNTEFWDLARSVRKAVHGSIDSGEPFVFVSLLDKLTPKKANPRDFSRRASEIYPAALMVTNLGLLDAHEDCSPLELENVHFAISNKAVPDIFGAAVVTYQHQLTINFSYVVPVLSHRRAAELVEDTMGLLRVNSS